jgi:phosphotransacetylase
MCLEDRVSVFGDCAINQILLQTISRNSISSADSSLAFGIEPKFAMLSYSSGSSGGKVDKVRTATEIVTKRPDLKSKALFNMMLRLIWLLEKVKCQIQKWQDNQRFLIFRI